MERSNIEWFNLINRSMKIGYYLLYGFTIMGVLLFITVGKDFTPEGLIINAIIISTFTLIPAAVLQCIRKVYVAKRHPENINKKKGIGVEYGKKK